MCGPAPSRGVLGKITVRIMVVGGRVRRGNAKQKEKRRLAKHMCLHVCEVTEFFFCVVTLRDLRLGSHCTNHCLS